MPTEVKDFIPVQDVKKSVAYNLGLKRLDIVALCLDLVLDTAEILFDVYPLLWYSWIVAGQKMGICGGDTGYTFGLWG